MKACENVERLAPCCHHLLRCSCNREDPRATTAASGLNFAPCPMKYAPGILCSERVHLHGDVLFQSSRHGTAQEKNAVECTNTRLDLTICIFTLAPGQPGSILNIQACNLLSFPAWVQTLCLASQSTGKESSEKPQLQNCNPVFMMQLSSPTLQNKSRAGWRSVYTQPRSHRWQTRFKS